ncbi:common pilus major fimbrillin subunit EcpA [Proteus mirabilis]|uniref:common pilus major fimbrillin subunit EcpA n=1 Tax=Proteus mirabilis TaxID=584 RepID=UPI002DB7564C|nr:common pilus major fimbrillin subunit EcpA [Proteus mirabilis]MEC3991927.1 common pilus major fimbrillin subunit EcpA [Proteus mirabilis]MEC4040687.1 common pilus major fimbrillin subunit EcpA [Proteus mirabilis]MEC4068816.1 common pilus major fimbrillin subunit EcpA [Proteus mirabilis]MEC4099067.1 common pilus major fimbrillin subunit EcpA [Proteus mirabilis]
MKKLTLGIIVGSLFTIPLSVNAATKTATATATWQATAIKDTSSALVVTPLKTLTFNYAEGQKSFNQQDGAFDIAIQGVESATDFELTSKLITNTLTRTTDESVLTVGVKWNGQALSESTPVTLIDTANGSTSGLDKLGLPESYASADRTTDRGTFNFNIASATSDGSTSTTFEELADGVWDGDVKVQFTAVWTTP